MRPDWSDTCHKSMDTMSHKMQTHNDVHPSGRRVVLSQLTDNFLQILLDCERWLRRDMNQLRLNIVGWCGFHVSRYVTVACSQVVFPASSLRESFQTHGMALK